MDPPSYGIYINVFRRQIKLLVIYFELLLHTVSRHDTEGLNTVRTHRRLKELSEGVRKAIEGNMHMFEPVCRCAALETGTGRFTPPSPL